MISTFEKLAASARRLPKAQRVRLIGMLSEDFFDGVKFPCVAVGNYRDQRLLLALMPKTKMKSYTGSDIRKHVPNIDEIRKAAKDSRKSKTIYETTVFID